MPRLCCVFGIEHAAGIAGPAMAGMAADAVMARASAARARLGWLLSIAPFVKARGRFA
jgi:hypothetical protein